MVTPAPSNNHFTASQVRLLDFEYGAFRHVLYDLAAWKILCPLPENPLDEMTAVFRAELSGAYPAIADDSFFKSEWTAICAWRALAVLTWISPAVISDNRPWAEGMDDARCRLRRNLAARRARPAMMWRSEPWAKARDF